MFKALMNLLLALTIASAAVGCATVEAPAPVMSGNEARPSSGTSTYYGYTKLEGPFVWGGIFPNSVLSSFADKYTALMKLFGEAMEARSALEQQAQLGCKQRKAQTIVDGQLIRYETALNGALRALNELQQTENKVHQFPPIEDIEQQILDLSNQERRNAVASGRLTTKDYQEQLAYAVETKRMCQAAFGARAEASKNFMWHASNVETKERELKSAMSLYIAQSCENK
jgi:hypothetical protein